MNYYARVLSVNIGRLENNAFRKGLMTGHGKKPIEGEVYVSAPNVRKGVSGLAGDSIGDTASHGGDDQAIYCFQREDMDHWQTVKGIVLPNGGFGENLTTIGIDINNAVIGEQWRIGSQLIAQVTKPRIPCATIRSVDAAPGWIREYVASGRPGMYLRVIQPGAIRAGDRIDLLHRPDHGITIAMAFHAYTTDRSQLPTLLAAGDDLPADFLEKAKKSDITQFHDQKR